MGVAVVVSFYIGWPEGLTEKSSTPCRYLGQKSILGRRNSKYSKTDPNMISGNQKI